jgi:hypothetical protein
MTDTRRLRSLCALAGLVLLAACGDFDVANENAPTTDQLEGNPTRAILARSATGIFTGVTGVIPGVGGNDVGGEIQQYGITAGSCTTWPGTTRARPVRSFEARRIPVVAPARAGPTCTLTSEHQRLSPRGRELHGAL